MYVCVCVCVCVRVCVCVCVCSCKPGWGGGPVNYTCNLNGEWEGKLACDRTCHPNYVCILLLGAWVIPVGARVRPITLWALLGCVRAPALSCPCILHGAQCCRSAFGIVPCPCTHATVSCVSARHALMGPMLAHWAHVVLHLGIPSPLLFTLHRLTDPASPCTDSLTRSLLGPHSVRLRGERDEPGRASDGAVHGQHVLRRRQLHGNMQLRLRPGVCCLRAPQCVCVCERVCIRCYKIRDVFGSKTRAPVCARACVCMFVCVFLPCTALLLVTGPTESSVRRAWQVGADQTRGQRDVFC